MIEVRKGGAWMQIDTHGAQMMAYCDQNGKRWLWSGDSAVWGKVAPILFPFIGNLKDGVVRIGGVAYAVPRHGFAQHMDFMLREQGEDFCTLEITDTEETRAVYPYAFSLQVTYRLLPKGFLAELTVGNLGDSTMPFALGGHPAIACPMEAGEQFSDYQVRFETEEEGKNLVCSPIGLMAGTETVDLGSDHRTLSLSYDAFDEKDTYVFAGLKSRSVELIHKHTRKGIRFTFPQSTTLALWTMPKKQGAFLCLEPWNGLPAFVDETGNFEDKPYHIDLEPKETFTLSYGVEILGE